MTPSTWAWGGPTNPRVDVLLLLYAASDPELRTHTEAISRLVPADGGSGQRPERTSAPGLAHLAESESLVVARGSVPSYATPEAAAIHPVQRG